MAGEHERLEGVASWYSSRSGFYSQLVGYGFRSLQPHFAGSTCLELGPADGQMTGLLLEHFSSVVSVDGSVTFCDQLRKHFDGEPRLAVECSLFEDYKPDRRFGTVLGTHILEHVEDPVTVLRGARDWIDDGGRLVMLVPNAQSIHRLVAVAMGLLPAPDALNDLDVRLGHRRVYDMPLLREHVADAGWTVVETGGVFLKPLSNGQIEEWFDERMMDGFFEIGKRFPENAAEIFVVAQR